MTPRPSAGSPRPRRPAASCWPWPPSEPPASPGSLPADPASAAAKSGKHEYTLTVLGTAALASAFARAGRRPGAWERGPAEGVQALRAWFAREAGGRFGGHDIVICPGGQAALVTAVRALAPPGGPVVVESPTYRGALAAVRAAGLTPVPVPSDADGVRPAMLADALARTGARVAYLQPLHANPHGADLSAERRAEVMEVAARFGAFLIEDDWARDLTIDGPAPAPLAANDPDGHIVYVRSLSKGASPGLRSPPSPLAARPVRACARRGSSRTCSSARRSSTRRSSSSPHRAGAGMKALREGLRERRDALTGALAEHFGAARCGASRPAGCTCGCGCPTGRTRTGSSPPRRARASTSAVPAQLRGRADGPRICG